jgi:tryptophan synthase alpha chain
MLSRFRREGRAAFIPFIVAGYPLAEPGLCERVVDALVEEGADALELGVPFSDALADGPVIQAASESTARRFSLGDVLALASRIRARHPELPLILFTYFNPVLQAGLADFARRARAAGVTAVLVVDLPPEESADYRAALAAEGLRTVFLAAPTTDASRILAIAQASSGFLYYVSRTGVTGEQSTISSSLAQEVARIRERTDLPVAVGFGISNAAQAREVARLGDAVVVGSAFVRLMGQPGDPEKVLTRVRELARELVRGIRSR